MSETNPTLVVAEYEDTTVASLADILNQTIGVTKDALLSEHGFKASKGADVIPEPLFQKILTEKGFQFKEIQAGSNNSDDQADKNLALKAALEKEKGKETKEPGADLPPENPSGEAPKAETETVPAQKFSGQKEMMLHPQGFKTMVKVELVESFLTQGYTRIQPKD